MTPHQLIFTDVRGKTLRLFGDAPAEMLTWAPAGTANHVLWHAGHAAWVIDVLLVKALTGNGELPEDWTARFGARGTSPRDTRDWPAREALIESLKKQHDRVMQLLASATPQLLSRTPRENNPATVEQWLLHGIHDEAAHQGEMHLLTKLWKAGLR